MDENLTEQQQVEQLKEWWKNNWTSIVFGAVIGLGALGGWKFWQQHKEATAVAASDAYEAAVKLSEDESKTSEFVSATEALVKNHDGTIYAQFGQLYLAKEAVEASDLEKAASYLVAVKSKPMHDAIKHIANVRLARIRLAQQKLDEALTLATATKEEAGAYFAAYSVVKGDVLLAQGKTAEANAAFAEAKSAGELMANHPELNLKLDVTTL